jgi:hypothetical protein
MHFKVFGTIINATKLHPTNQNVQYPKLRSPKDPKSKENNETMIKPKTGD